MKLPVSFKKFSVIEILLLISYIIYIIFPIATPSWLAPWVESPLGLVVIFAITVGLFVYTNPILGVIYIFVAYELLRRSALVKAPIYHDDHAIQELLPTRHADHIPSQSKKDAELQQLNPPQPATLEEEIIQIRAPIGKSDKISFTESQFKPVAETLEGASLF